MSSLVAPRPPGWRMREDDDRQGSLFGGDAFRPQARAPLPRPAEPPRATPAPPEDPAPPRDEQPPPESAAAPPRDVTVPRESAAAPPRDVTVPRESAAAAPADVTAAPEGVASSPPRDLASPADVATRGLVVPEEGVEEFRVSRAAGAELAGATLDDAVSRAWEGLVAGVPVACPVCHGEIEPSLGGGLQGRCGTCHAALD